jgi:spore maturation protein CgeB
MKFLQIHTYYPKYLESLYQQRPGLGALPYDQQLAEIVNDGFAGSHLFGIHMAEANYQSQLIIANCPQLQVKWCEENKVVIQYPEKWIYEVTLRQIEAIQPDILYLSDPINFDAQFLRALSWKPTLVVGWRAASIANGTNWSGFDLLLSHLRVCRETALQIGAKSAAHFFPGVPESILKAIEDEPKKYDVVFTGQWTREHAARNEFLTHAVETVVNRNAKLGLFLAAQYPQEVPQLLQKNNQGERWGVQMHRALKSGRIILNAEIDIARGEAGNMRLFEATSAGSFLLTQHQSNIERYFKPGYEVETFKDKNELAEKINYYLDHSEEREAIAKRGYERCVGEYNMHNRVREFDRILKKYLSLKQVQLKQVHAHAN